ncbi:MAG: hypothetical protein LDLANPLL_00307 [Turneriella sp.]|nr:hypothetical protein [Turneriella sp.]
MPRENEEQYYLSLGAGENQLPLIRAARAHGLKVIAVDQNISSPGFKESDLRIQESILNYRKIYYKIVGVVDQTQIIGGYAATYGAALQSFAFLCERLRLIGLSRTLIETVQDKLQVRKLVASIEHNSFAQPLFLEITQSIRREEVEQLGFPLIAKIRRGASKRHVYKLDNWGEVRNFLSRRNLAELGIRGSDFILEQFIEGDEIIVTGFAQNFNFHLISIHDRIASKNPPFIDLEHKFPSKYKNLAQNIREVHNQVCVKLQLADTPVVSEWKVVAGRLYLVEFSAQIPGEHVADFLIPKGLKYDYFQNLVRLTIGEKVEAPIEKNPQQITIKFWPQNPGSSQWQEAIQRAAFARILNDNSPKKISSNLDRYAVAGFIGS